MDVSGVSNYEGTHTPPNKVTGKRKRGDEDSISSSEGDGITGRITTPLFHIFTPEPLERIEFSIAAARKAYMKALSGGSNPSPTGEALAHMLAQKGSLLFKKRHEARLAGLPDREDTIPMQLLEIYTDLRVHWARLKGKKSREYADCTEKLAIVEGMRILTASDRDRRINHQGRVLALFNEALNIWANIEGKGVARDGITHGSVGAANRWELGISGLRGRRYLDCLQLQIRFFELVGTDNCPLYPSALNQAHLLACGKSLATLKGRQAWGAALLKMKCGALAVKQDRLIDAYDLYVQACTLASQAQWTIADLNETEREQLRVGLRQHLDVLTHFSGLIVSTNFIAVARTYVTLFPTTKLDRRWIAETLMAVGKTLLDAKDVERSLESLRLAEDICKTTPVSEATRANWRANVGLLAKQADGTFMTFARRYVSEFPNREADRRWIAETLMTVGKTLLDGKDVEGSLEAVQFAEEIYKTTSPSVARQAELILRRSLAKARVPKLAEEAGDEHRKFMGCVEALRDPAKAAPSDRLEMAALLKRGADEWLAMDRKIQTNRGMEYGSAAVELLKHLCEQYSRSLVYKQKLIEMMEWYVSIEPTDKVDAEKELKRVKQVAAEAPKGKISGRERTTYSKRLRRRAGEW